MKATLIPTLIVVAAVVVQAEALAPLPTQPRGSRSSASGSTRDHHRIRNTPFTRFFHDDSFALGSTQVDDDGVMERKPTSSLDTQSPRPILVRRIEQFARLPVWPAWYGVAIFVVARVLGDGAAAKLENAIGGRVCPNFYDPNETTPFVMLVHHCHSFLSFDPLRWFQRAAILPEGFPAHPHRGFTTITYFLKGGFRHRDSLGIQQKYGANTASAHRYKHHTQWLFTGAGLLHEEMFDFGTAGGSIWERQELYQLWLNVPAKNKLESPQCILMGDDDDNYPTPHARSDDGTETIVLAGTYRDASARAPAMSDVAIFHVQIPPGATWQHIVPAQHRTAFLYIRQGSGMLQSTELPVHHTVFFDTIPNRPSSIEIRAHDKDGMDFLFLSGQPLQEPISAQGSMVMTTPDQIDAAYQDYQRGYMGAPWDHAMSDAEWQQHVAQNPCQYKYSSTYGGDKPVMSKDDDSESR